jgi:ActR/RegA family two-component response regulator
MYPHTITYSIMMGEKFMNRSKKQTMVHTKSILLVDPDQHESRALFASLVRAGHSVTDTRRADFALEILADRSFEVAIVDLGSGEAASDDLIQKLTKDWNNPLIIGIADFSALIAGGAAVRRGPCYFMGKPLDLPRLVELVAADGPGSGRAMASDVVDYLRCIIATGKNAALGISDRQGQTCTLLVADGSLIHAVSGETEGANAFYKALAFEGGAFFHLPWTEPDRITIHHSTETLLSEAWDQACTPESHNGRL